MTPFLVVYFLQPSRSSANFLFGTLDFRLADGTKYQWHSRSFCALVFGSPFTGNAALFWLRVSVNAVISKAIMAIWTPNSPEVWATALGMVAVPLFGKDRQDVPPGNHALLLDGDRASFTLSVGNSESLLASDEPLSWSWSSNLNYSLLFNQEERKLFVRRWDRPKDILEWPMPDERRAWAIVEKLAADPSPSAGTVIDRLLGIFWALRRNIEDRGGNEADLIRSFNTLLVWADAMRRHLIDDTSSIGAVALRDILEFLGSRGLIEYDVSSLSNEAIRSFQLGNLLEAVLEKDPSTGVVLDPDLFIRHASGVLYEAAHIGLTNRPIQRIVQRTMFDMVSYDIARPSGIPNRDAHFTPPSLARALVQEAVNDIISMRGPLSRMLILDPACGSGIFLIEASRELSSIPDIKLSLKGIDRSEVSCIMTEFCVSRSVKDDGVRRLHVLTEDSLKSESWGKPDIILMNPPFISWEDMQPEDRKGVREALGNLKSRLPDSSLGFVVKAINSMKPGAVLASVVPGSFLNSTAAESLRERIQNDRSLSMRLIGKFKGFDYFQGAMVEPAFIVIAKYPARSRRPERPIRLVIAEAKHEDDAIRGLRRRYLDSSIYRDGWEVYDAEFTDLTSSSWVPASRLTASLFRSFRELELPVVADKFDVCQGVQTGNNSVFILNEMETNRFSADPGFSNFFRPVADEIKEGKIIKKDYIFYPYDDSGLTIKSEIQLKQELPLFFHERLDPNRADLAARKGLRGKPWWVLNWPRTKWQTKSLPRLVSTQFGNRGSFAFDQSGEYVVHAGNAWIWKHGSHDDDQIPWAYAALLNSRLFEGLLSHACTKIQGGQYNLNKKYVDNVRIQDLSDRRKVAEVTLRELAEVGRSLSDNMQPDWDLLDRLVADAYGFPVPRLKAALLPGYTEMIRARFIPLSEAWKKDTAHISNIAKSIQHRAYQEIISMGEDAILPILDDFRDRCTDWFPALAMITSQNPVPSESAGNVKEMAAAWLRWGASARYY